MHWKTVVVIAPELDKLQKMSEIDVMVRHGRDENYTQNIV
jgi:hypothetical protein